MPPLTYPARRPRQPRVTSSDRCGNLRAALIQNRDGPEEEEGTAPVIATVRERTGRIEPMGASGHGNIETWTTTNTRDSRVDLG